MNKEDQPKVQLLKFKNFQNKREQSKINYKPN